eukprot:GFKZ01000450.1.p1 GENE.GFKZ01000450.1~~GFKZ01000450.1.p1  ORF type:complete len:2373 (+),score=210.70 GFKZ01000450.1:93-7211(+)
MSKSTRPSPYPSNFAGRDEHADAERFAFALRPPPSGLHVVQNACPPVTPCSGGLDVLLFRAVLLVAYAASDEVVIARGTDLDALRRLRCPEGVQGAPVTAVAFRQRDAAIAVAFGNSIVVYEGWSDRAIEKQFVYDEDFIETVLDVGQIQTAESVVALSWNAAGTMLCAVAEGIFVWNLDPACRPVRYTLLQATKADALPTKSLSMGAISPDGAFVAASGLYTKMSYIWALPRRNQQETDKSLPCTELVHGRSGVAAMDWKKRGGGNQALMTVDRDGSIRLWVKTASSSRAGDSAANRPGLATGEESWMEEIARSPHVERTPRAGASFLNWGGGGGVADDEGDAMATNAAHLLLSEGTAPKPSRCIHWIIRVAGGDARAWKVRGLDDRPRAEFARLEPASGEPLMGVDESHDDDFGPSELPLRDLAVTSMKAVAPIPLTTGSDYKVGLVKSYAISNGERRLRSPEPPDPPNIVALFVLAVRKGLPFLARHDICPTSTMPAVCRARIGIGHSSAVEDLVVSDQSNTLMLSTDGWLASRGKNGDVIVWRTNVSTGAWEPMTAVAALPGPQTTVTFAPPRTTSPNLWELGVFACDSALGTLRLFKFVNLINQREKASAHDIQFAKPVAICHPRGKGKYDTTRQLIAIPLGMSYSDPVGSVRCALFGVRSGGRLCVWFVSRRRKDEIVIEPSVVRFVGEKHATVTCAAANAASNHARQVFATGGTDGTVLVYSVGESEVEQKIYGTSDSEDEEGEEGVVWLRELCRLKSATTEGSPVENLEILANGMRVMVLHANGRAFVWSRNSSDISDWSIELTIDNEKAFADSAVARESGIISVPISVDCGTSLGYDLDGNFSAVVSQRNGVFQRYRRVLGAPWECVQKNEVPWDSLPPQRHCVRHIGKGVLAVTNGRGISVLATTKPDSHPLSFISGAAGYSPSKALMAQLLTGGRAWQALSALDGLNEFVGNVMKRKASETSYSAGRGLIPPPPPLSTLLSDAEEAPLERKGLDAERNFEGREDLNTTPFQLSSATAIFARLMAKSEATALDDTAGENRDISDPYSRNSKDLSKLAHSLKLASLACVTRSEQTVLAAIARASSSVRSIFKSLDSSGAKYALIAACHLEISKTDTIPLSTVASAVHSTSADALMDHFLPARATGHVRSQEKTKMWNFARVLGAGWWIQTSSGCKKLAERIARSDFNSSKNADEAALWYIALGRRTALSALYRSQQNSRMAQFLRRDFGLPENRRAAGKNAYVLLSKHRLELAIAFFILADNVQGALNIVRSRIKDDQLALLLARTLGDEELVQITLEQVAKSATLSGDNHKKSIALWLAGQSEEALTAASVAHYPSKGVKLGDSERLLVGSLPGVVHSLSHVLAIASRPSLRGTKLALSTVEGCRRKASHALLGDGSPVAALVVNFDRMRATDNGSVNHRKGISSKTEIEIWQSSLLIAAVDTLKGRAVCLAGAVISGAQDKSLEELLRQDLVDLTGSPLGIEITIKAVERAAFELCNEDEVDSALAATCAALTVLEKQESRQSTFLQAVETAQRNCLRVAVSRALFHVQGALSLLHHPTFSSQRLSELLLKYDATGSLVEKSISPRNDLFRRLVIEFRGAVASLRFANAFLRGDWPGILYSLRSCELSWQQKSSLAVDDQQTEREQEDNSSLTSGCSSYAPDSVSVEALRHVASNPAILGLSRSLTHIRRNRKTPSMTMVGVSGGAATTVTDDSISSPTLTVNANDPCAVIRIHPALSSTLAAACAAYFATHLAASAAAFSKSEADDRRHWERSSQLFWQPGRGKGYDQSFRLMRASEVLEQIAEDAIAQWTPLQRFGAEASVGSMSQPDESAGAFVDLWSTLGCLPEYAPSLSEAATVAAAEMAAAASRAAIEAAEQKDGGRRRRRRRERRGEVVQSVAKEGLKLFDTTSADSLYGAYPVRFSASAIGPWSGRGRNASLYREERALFRTLCVSSTDPPAVIVATPKGIQEIVPSSYTTMPAGFRSHYASRRVENQGLQNDERLAALAMDRDLDNIREKREEEDSFLSTYDGFGEGPYVALELEANEAGRRRSQQVTSQGHKVVWRHQVLATTLASHPLRRRFASGGTDGVVRLWDFADPISLASFREDNFGRVSDVCFSAYGNTMLAVYASGQVFVWDDPDTYSSHPRGDRGVNGSRAKSIRAFDNRAASAGTFLDERHVVAIVGDPTAPPSVNHSLRIFDTREPNSSFHASWSAAVNHQSEARRLALLEDRMRLVTGGLDGSLSVVDIRTKTCVAELPAHTDEVTCIALEMPRGRAMVTGSANGEIKLWDSRTLLQLDIIPEAHTPTRHYWSGNGIGGLVGSYGTQGLALTDRSLISCGGDGVVKIWGPGWSDFDLNVI